jgi:hypothetical protein
MKPFYKSKQISWQYIAGFFDGEGTVCFARYGHLKKRYALAAMSQADFQGGVIYVIKDFLKENRIESRITKDKRFRNGERAEGYQLRLYMSGLGSVREFLNQVLPYLIVKREKALEVLSSIGEDNWNTKFTLRERDTIVESRKQGYSFDRISTLINRPSGSIKRYYYRKIYERKEVLPQSHALA